MQDVLTSARKTRARTKRTVPPAGVSDGGQNVPGP